MRTRLGWTMSVAFLGACNGDVSVATESSSTSSGESSSSGGGPNTSLTGAATTDTPADSSGPGPASTTEGGSSSTGPAASAHLDVHVIGCEGSVVSEPAGIDCGETCEADFAVGTAVTLTATPGAYPLREWKDGCFGNEPTCELTLEADTERTAQFTDMRWMKSLGGAMDDVYGHPRAVAADDAAGVFIGGYYSGGVFQFGSPSGLPCVDAITAGFINKLSAVDGVEQWHHCLSTNNDSIIAQNSVMGVGTEPVSGDAYASGYFSYQPNSPVPTGGVDFGGGEVTCTPPDGFAVSMGMFVARYRNNDGAHMWSRAFCTGSFIADAGSLAVAGNGDVYPVFDVGSTFADYDLGGDTFPADPNVRTHVAKYAADDGAHIWSVIAPSALWTNGADADDTGVYITGIGWNDNHGVVTKLSADDGSQLWTVAIAPEAAATPTGVAVTDDGIVVVSGSSYGSADFGAGLVDLPPNISTLFLAAYDATTGAYLWARTFECDSEGDPLTEGAVHIDPNGDILMTAGFSGNCDLGGGPIVSVGLEDLFLGRYAADDGTLLELRTIAGGDVVGQAITVDSGGNPFFAAHLAGEATYCGDELDTTAFDGILYGSILP